MIERIALARNNKSIVINYYRIIDIHTVGAFSNIYFLLTYEGTNIRHSRLQYPAVHYRQRRFQSQSQVQTHCWSSKRVTFRKSTNARRIGSRRKSRCSAVDTKHLLFRRKRFHSGRGGKLNDASDAAPLHPASLHPFPHSHHHLSRSIVRPCTSLCFHFCFDPALVSAPMFETVRRARKEGVRHTPEGLVGLRTHRDRVEVSIALKQL